MSFPKPLAEYPDTCAVPLAQLIAAYEDSIDILYESCHAEIEAHKLVEKADPNFGDDIYLLRYVLSHHKKGVEKAVNALKATIKWRAQHQVILPAIRNGTQAPPKDEVLRPYFPMSPHYRTTDGHIIYVVRNGIANGHAAFEGKATPEDMADWATLSKEAMFGISDSETRKAGRLLKLVTLMDFKGAGLSSYNGKLNSSMSRASKESELYYPQLLRRSIIFNMPSVIGTIVSVFLKLMPHSLQEKISICNEHSPEGIRRVCREELHIDIKDLPTFLGGECECEGGCIRNVPNAQCERITAEEVSTRKQTSWLQSLERINRPTVKVDDMPNK